MKSFGETLKELRLTQAMNQETLGKNLAVSQDTISLWERNKSLPDFESIKKLATLFDVTADYILGLSDY